MSRERTMQTITDISALKISLYWLNFAIAAYGPFIINWCGFGSGFILDNLKQNASKKAAAQLMNIPLSDILVWEFDGSEVFKPSFFICKDDRTRSIVLSIRGTWSIQDTITDFSAEYEPFRNGFVHRGFLRCAEWIRSHYLDELLDFIDTHKSDALYIVGHSLGGAIASLFSILFQENADKIKLKNPKFIFHCYNFAPPATCSLNISERYAHLIDSYINESDIVPRLSYGSMCDFKELVKSAAGIVKSKGTQADKMGALDLVRKKLSAESDHPKIYIPGNVFYVYKTSRAVAKYGFTNKNENKNSQTEEAGHYCVEKSTRSHFSSMYFKRSLLRDHFPDRYENSLKSAVEWLEAQKPPSFE